MNLGKLRRPYSKIHEIARRTITRLDYLVWLLFDPCKYKRIHSQNIKNVLVVLMGDKEGNIGGNFCSLGVLNHIKKERPELHITLLSDKYSIKQFGEQPGIEIVEYKDGKTLESLQERKYDAALFLTLGSLRITDFSFIPYRAIRPTANIRHLLKLQNKLFVTRKTNISWMDHMVDVRFKLFNSLGITCKSKGLVFHHDKQEERKVKDFLKKQSIKKYIVLQPGGKHVVQSYKSGKWPPHLWPLDRYAKVADHFSKKGFAILVTGSPDESLLAEEIQKHASCNVVNCCGKFSIRETGVLLKGASTLVSTDTSTVHIAYQLDIPIVELMGPSYPEIVGAWPLTSKRHKILFKENQCAKSMKKIACSENRVCMQDISVEEVISAAESLLKMK